MPGESNPKFTPQQMIDAIMESRGLISVAARRLACHPDTVRRYSARHARVGSALVEAREQTTDLAEAALFKAIGAGEPWAVTLYLKTIGRTRGYVERLEQQHSGPDGGPLTLTVTVIDDRSN